MFSSKSEMNRIDFNLNNHYSDNIEELKVMLKTIFAANFKEKKRERHTYD